MSTKTWRRNAGWKRAGLTTRHYILFIVAGLPASPAEAGRVRAPKGYTQVWSDEFKGKNGSLPDRTKWTYDIGGSGWGNHELEYYTNRAENARIEHGKLVITARAETFTGPDGTFRQTAELTQGQRGILASLQIPSPRKIIEAAPAAALAPGKAAASA